MLILKQSTAVTVKIGPFIDDTDGKTAETGLTLSQADIRLSKNGGDIAQKNESSAATHDELGYYNCALDTTDTETLGRLQLAVHESGALPVWHEFMICPANVWDSLFGEDRLQVHAAEITNGLITAAAIATDAIDADAIATDAVTELQAGLATAAALAVVDDYLDTEVAAILADTHELQGDLTDGGRIDLLIDAIKAKTDNLPADPADDSDLDTQLAAIKSVVDDILVDTGTTLEADLDAILADTSELQGDLADGGRLDLLIDAILADTGTDGVPLTAAAVDAILDEVFEGTLTLRQFLRLAKAALAGKAAGGGTDTITFRDHADAKDRITATVDENGNRTAVTLDVT
jgi:hypothetical protein